MAIMQETELVSDNQPQEECVNETTNSEHGSYEDGVIAGLQEAILAIMEKNGNVTDQMRQDVYNNVYHDSLINWIKSFIR